jgi:uncharacterized protein DUF1566
MRLIIAVMALRLLAGNAGAVSPAKECREACGGLIASCAARNQDVGGLQSACRAAALKRCRKLGPGVCIPAVSAGSTTSTTTSTTSTTSTSTTTTTLRFVDNGDGTVTDHQTGLVWEKKVAGISCGPLFFPLALHCVDDTYRWISVPMLSGEPFTSFLAALNGGATGVGDCVSADGKAVTGGFNGHCDWRLPTVDELQTIVDPGAAGCGSGSPCIDPIFGPTAVAGYWSSTTAADPDTAWVVFFDGSRMFDTGKLILNFVRAVRGGS